MDAGANGRKILPIIGILVAESHDEVVDSAE